MKDLGLLGLSALHNAVENWYQSRSRAWAVLFLAS